MFERVQYSVYCVQCICILGWNIDAQWLMVSAVCICVYTSGGHFISVIYLSHSLHPRYTPSFFHSSSFSPYSFRNGRAVFNPIRLIYVSVSCQMISPIVGVNSWTPLNLKKKSKWKCWLSACSAILPALSKNVLEFQDLKKSNWIYEIITV